MKADRPNPITGKHRRAVGVFPERRVAEQALHELRDSGFPMDRVSVIARDADRHEEIAGADVHDPDRASRIGNKADEGAAVGAATGGALGGLTGLLVGLGTLAIPGIGPVMLAGATATVLATALAGGAIGAVTGGLLGALVGLGIPEERARVYNDRVARGDYLVIVDGTDEEIARAEQILHHRGIEEYGVYDAPTSAATPVAAATPGVVHSDRESVMPMGRHHHAVGFFPNRRDAEVAVADLRNAGFPLHQVSLVARRFEQREPFAGLDLRDRFEAMRYGIPTERARLYDQRLDRGDYLVVVNGTEDELRRAAGILNQRGIQDWSIYPPAEQRLGDQSTPLTTGQTAGVAPMTGVHSTPGAPMAGRTLQRKRAIGVFAHRRDTEAALMDLRDSGFSMNQISLIAKDADRQTPIAGANAGVDVNRPTGNKADEGAKAGAATGATLGGLGGLLVGLGALAIPGLGPVMLGGAAATALATAVSGGAIGAAAGGVAGGLVGMGVPENQARVYNDRLNRGDDLIMVDGSEDEVRRAEAVLKRHGIQEWNIFDASDVHATDRPADRAVDRTDRVVDRTDPSYVPGENPDIRQSRHEPDVTIIDRRDEPR